MATETTTENGPGLARLVGGIVEDAQNLIRQQFALVRSEIQQELRQARNAAISFGVGTGLAIFATILLLLMVVQLLALTGLPLWACYAIVGGVLGLAAGGLFLWGSKEASDVHLLAPPQTVQSVRENIQWMQGETTSDHR